MRLKEVPLYMEFRSLNTLKMMVTQFIGEIEHGVKGRKRRVRVEDAKSARRLLPYLTKKIEKRLELNVTAIEVKYSHKQRKLLLMLINEKLTSLAAQKESIFQELANGTDDAESKYVELSQLARYRSTLVELTNKLGGPYAKN